MMNTENQKKDWKTIPYDETIVLDDNTNTKPNWKGYCAICQKRYGDWTRKGRVVWGTCPRCWKSQHESFMKKAREDNAAKAFAKTNMASDGVTGFNGESF
jgi:hypothetical protein